MNKLTGVIAIGAVITGLGSAALAQHAGHRTSHDGAATKQVAPSKSAFVKAYTEAHQKMMRDMDIKLSGNPDVDFVRGMIPHHQGAIDMAKIQLAHGKDPELRKLAEQIIKDQEKEIGQMNSWLKKNSK